MRGGRSIKINRTLGLVFWAMSVASVSVGSAGVGPARRAAAGRAHVWWGLSLSLLVHVAGGLLTARLGIVAPDSGGVVHWALRPSSSAILVEWAPPEAPEPPAAPPEPAQIPPEPPDSKAEPDDPLKLGIARSDQPTDNVMGFADPSPHSARESLVDQPALDPMPGGGGGEAGGSDAPAGPEHATTSPTPPSAPAEAVLIGPPAPAERERAAAPRGDAEQSSKSITEAQAGEGVETPPGIGPPAGGPEQRSPKPAAVAGRPSDATGDGDAAESAPPQVPMGPPPAPQPGPRTAVTDPPVQPGIGAAPGPLAAQSDSEADAASRQKPIEVVLGRPAAGEGLRIITKRPKRNPFSLLTRVTAMPRNPVIEVLFDRNGRVVDAKVTQSSGVADVDGPVLAAVYSWTAEGRRLAELGRDERLTVVVTILLR